MDFVRTDAVVNQCPMCARPLTLGDVLSHPEVKPIGMAFLGGENLYYFNHVCAGCGSTFTVPVELFLPLLPERVPPESLESTSSCERHCRRVKDLERCSQPCRYAPFRRFLIDRLVPRTAG